MPTSELVAKLLEHKTGLAALCGNIHIPKMLLHCKIIFIGYITQIQDLHGKSCIYQEEESFYQQIGLKFEEETSEVLRLRVALYGAETWTLRATDQKHLESFEMWSWRRSVGPIM